MKKILLFLTLLLCTVFGTVRANEVTIGELEGATNNSYLPMNSFYNYSYSQQIYTAGEIGMAGTINSITLWMYGNADLYDMPIDIYMVETDKDAFSSNTDWVTVSAGDIVYSGSVTVHNTDAQAFTFNLATPFVYSGTDNLLIAVNNTTGNWKGGLNGMVFGVSGDPVRAIYARQDGSAYDPTNPTFTAYATTYLRNVITLDITPGGGGTVCDKPSDMTVSNVESTSAILAWAGGSGSYNVDYKKTSESAWTPLLSGSTLTTTTLSGLQPGTTYQARVQSVCTDGTSAYKSVGFTTLYGVPFEEPFGTSLPANWSKYATLLTDDVLNGTTPLPSGGSWNFGASNGVFDNHARVNVYGVSCTSWLVTPAIQMSPNAQLTFDLALTAFSGNNVPAPDLTGTDDKFVVLISTDDGATWSILRQWDNAGSAYVYNDIACSADGEEVVIDLSAYSSGSVMIAFYTESTASNADNNLHIDNVKVDEIPSCFKPTNVVASNISSTGATLTWTPGGSETEWTVQYSTDSEFASDIHSEIANGTPILALTGLTPETKYYARVQANCGGTDGDSEWSSSISFTTPANAPEVADGKLTVYDGTATSNRSPMYVYYFDNYTRSQYIIPAGDLVHMNGMKILSIKYYTSYTSAYTTASPVDLYIKEVPYSSFSAPYTFESKEAEAIYYQGTVDFVLEGSEATATITLNAPYTYHGGNLLIGFDNTTDAGYKSISFYGKNMPNACVYGNNDTSLDDVTATMINFIPKTTFEVADGSACIKPVSLSVSDIEAHKATLSWASGDAAWQVCLEGGEASPIDVTSKSYTFTGLDAETDYVAKVRTNCGGSYSKWASKAFTTKEACAKPENFVADPVSGRSATISWEWPGVPDNGFRVSHRTTIDMENVIFSDDFEGGDLSQWTIYTEGDAAAEWVAFDVTSTKFTSHGGSYTAKASSYDGSSGLNADNWLVSPQITLPASNAILRYWILAPDPSWPDSYEVSISTTDNAITSFTTLTGMNPAPATDAWEEVIIDLSAYNGQQVYIAFHHVDYDMYYLFLDDVEVGAGTTPDWTVDADITTTSYKLTGLLPETKYEVQVQALCGVDGSSYSDIFRFTTLESCPKPSNITISDVTANSAQVSWTAGGDETAWALEYKPSNAAEWTVVNVNTNTYQLTGLETETTYNVRIKAICAEAEHSAYTATAFTTDFGTGWIHYDDGTFASGVGNSGVNTFTWGIKIPAPLPASILSKIAVYEQSGYNTEPFTLNVYNIEPGETPASTGVVALYTQVFDPIVSDAYHIVPLTTPVSVDTDKDLWITLTETGSYIIAGANTQGDPNGRWIDIGTGWSDIVDVSSSLTYDWMLRAYLTESYTVTFKDWDGTVLSTQSVAHGSSAIAPADPIREGYTFTGWDNSFDNVTGDLVVTAQYAIKTFTVTIIAGEYNYSENFPYGTPISALLAAAIATAGGQYMTVDMVYTFVGWSPEPATILTDNVTYTAIYTSAPRQYSVTFKDWNGTVLSSQNVAYGTAATPPTNPSREGYTFTGWDTSFDNITGDLIVTAQYTLNQYTVTFKDWNGTVIGTQSVAHGVSAIAPSDPIREGYTFTGWDKAFTNITADLIVTAQYSINSYLLTYKVDGVVYGVPQSIEFGAAITPAAAPTKEGYTFSGWSAIPATMPAHDVVITGSFIINQYTVTFKDWDGTTLKTQNVDWNTAAVAPANPSREGYTFTGWDKTFTNVKADLIVTAQYAINQFTVIFKDWDGSVLKSQTVDWNTAAIAPADPIREGYTFAGWDKAFDHVKADMTVTAQYTINSYTVTFKDWDGTVLKTQTVEYGQAATAPADPSRSGWTFAGWDKAFNVITSDLVVTARYTKNPVYTVNFVDWDETVISTQSVEQGQAAIAPANPVREGYTFTGWDASFTNVTSNLTIHAQYTINSYTLTYMVDGDLYGTPQVIAYGATITPMAAPAEREGYTFSGWSEIPATMPAHDVTITGSFIINQYTVTFKDWTGAIIGAPQIVTYGNAAVAPVAPLREGYTFTGWDKDFSNVKSDLVVIAQYRINTFTVVFKDWNGTVLSSQTVNWNAAAEAPADPTREGYTFTGWDKAFGIITADLTVTAQYTINQYTVTFKDWNGTTLKTQTVDWNTAAVAPADPSREGYTFTGWDKAFTNVKADLIVTAQYAINQYTVTFKDWDGTTLSTQTVNWNAAAVAPANPSREGYTFSGWDKTFNNVKTNLVVTAQYTINTYVVTFVDYNGTVLKTQTVNWNAAAVAPADPSREGYTFTGWDKAFDHVKSALTVTAQYRINVYRLSYMAEGTEVAFDSIAYMAPVDVTLHNGDAPAKAGHTFTGWTPAITNMPAHNDTVTAVYTINTFTVVFKDYNGTVLKTQTVDWNTAAVAPANPSREGCTFTGWDKTFDHVTENMIITAQYSILTFTVTFKDWDGTVLKTQTVEYGQAATAPADPTRSGWTFSGWDKAFNVVKSDLVVTARYTQNPVYTVNFVDWNETIISTQQVEQGQAAIAPANPVREGYTFTGWDASFTNVTSNMTIHAQYTINSYVLKYVLDGEEYSSQTIPFNTVITPLAAPSAREGYTFSGWSEIPATMPAHDMTITGSFSINSYRLTYMVDGVVYGAVETIEYNAAVVLRAEPTREGYTFSGWQGGVSTMPAHDVVISGSFTVNTYRLTYMVDGAEYAIDSIAYGATVTLMDAPAREGYTFSGWSAAPTAMPAHDVTVTGTFTVNTYQLIYKVDGEIYSQNMVAYGTALTAIAAPADREGYTFSGWSEIPATMPAHDVTVTGSFSINSYNLIYMVDGRVYATQTLQYGAAITLKPAPTKTGYTFSGWSAAPTTMPAHDVTVSGTFTIMTFTVIFKDYDGTVLSMQTVNYGEPAIAPADPTREGYTFAGWNQAFNSVTSDMEIVARYTQNTVYTVIFVDWDETVISTQQVEQGQAAVAPANPSREGYTFTGWDASFTNVTSNMTIHALYTINIYNVTFVAGTWTRTFPLPYGTDLAALEQQVYVMIGGRTIVNTDSIYTLVAWSPELAPVTADVTYTAIYEAVARQYLIVFVNGNDTLFTDSVDYGQIPVYEGEIPTKPSDEQYTYTFSGWNPEIVAVSGDAVYTAVFDAQPIEPGTGLIRPEAEEKVEKFIMEDKIYIRRGGRLYSAQGHLIQ